jgi:hypothetical protein
MIPAKQRRTITAVLDLYPGDIELRMNDALPDGAFGIVGEYGETPYIVGSTRMINWARDIREGNLVPEIYSDEASTWA